MEFKKVLTTSIALAALAFSASSSALYINFTSGAISETVYDNLAGDDSAFNNVIDFGQTIGGWDVVSGLSYNLAGPGEIFYLETTAKDLPMNGSVTDDLTVTAYAEGLTDAGSLASFNAFVNVTGSATSIFSLSTDGGLNWTDLSTFTSSDPSGHGDFYNLASFDGIGTFDLKIEQTFTSSGGAITSVTVPEPSVIALFGLGLAGLGFAARKKKQA